MFNVLKDVKSGALPVREVPGYLAFLIGRAFWPMIALIVAGLVILVIR